MNTILNLFNTDTWKALEKKPLLYVGFHEKDGAFYVVASTQKELMFVQEFDRNQSRNNVIERLKKDCASDVPVIFNPTKTASFFESYAAK